MNSNAEVFVSESLQPHEATTECGHKSRRAIFLDRDGTINVDRSDYVKTWQEFVFCPRSLDALGRLARLDADIIIITNQSAIGRGVIGLDTALDITRRMLTEIERWGGRVTAVYICPHSPRAGCACRKPKPGLLFLAKSRYQLNLASSFIIGDRESDVEAGVAVGCQPILLSSLRITGWANQRDPSVPVFRELYEAAEYVEARLFV